MYAKIEIPPFFLYSLEAALVLFYTAKVLILQTLKVHITLPTTTGL